MDEKALLEQMADMLEGQTQQVSGMFDDRMRQVSGMFENYTQRVELKIENDVTKRIEALFDGYKLTHEKQYELEREIEAMKPLIENLQNRIAALENRIA